MRGVWVALIALAVVAVPVAVAGTAAAGTTVSASASRDLTPVVIGPRSTDRFGGGDWLGVSAGDANFGVLYGTPEQPNAVYVFAEYTRYLGGAQIVNEEGQYLATRGIPVRTVLAQSLDRFIEFKTVNESALFDLFSANGTVVTWPVNVPMKALNLRTAQWNLTGFGSDVVGGTTFVNFTLAAHDVPYTLETLWDHGAIGNGVVDEIAFTFHLKVDVVVRSGEVPWYRVTVTDTAPREVTNVSFLEWKNVSGPAVRMGAKYDHLIRGWDFANDTDRLALETHLVFGNYFPDRTVDFVHMAYATSDHADDGANGTVLSNATAGDAPTAPHLYTRDRIYFDDAFTRIGEFRWVSNVTVDGQSESMLFQVQGGGRLAVSHAGAWFFGFWIRGAYVYPAGASIEHDPSVSVESFVPGVTTGFNLTPLGILLIQVAVVGVAIVPALYLRSKARRQA